MNHPLKRAGASTRLLPALLLTAPLLSALLLPALIGCGTSRRLVNVWKDPQAPAAPLKNVLVVAMIKDEGARRLWEDEFVQAFSGDRVTVTPSYRLYPSAVPDTQQVVRAVREGGLDGVIVTSRLPTRTETTYVPGSVSSVPATGYDPWLNAFYTYYEHVYQPGYTETSTVFRYRTDVWSVRGREGQLVWSGTSELIDPDSSGDMRRYVAEMVVPELVKEDVVGEGV